jgi:uncharacterized protein involved in exopolysaccharide biosynthesis
LNALLVELQNKRITLLTNFKASDRFLHELDEQIATTKAAMNDATASTSHEKSTDVDPAWQGLHTNYVQAQISRKQAAVHKSGVASDLATLRQNLANTQQLTVEFNNLDARANQAKQNFELYAQKRDQAQIEDAMDEQKLINVAVAQKPTLSYAAVTPKPVSNAILGAVTSISWRCAGYTSPRAAGTAYPLFRSRAYVRAESCFGTSRRAHQFARIRRLLNSHA